MRKFCLVKSLIFEIQNLENACKVLFGNQEFHVPFWSMIYLAMKFEFLLDVSFRNSILISIASK